MRIWQHELYPDVCITIPGAALLHNPRGLGCSTGMGGMCLWMVWRDFRLQKRLIQVWGTSGSEESTVSYCQWEADPGANPL